MKTIQEIMLKINQFRDERDWRQFHNPKNLAMALSVEVAEIVERFQWLTLDESANLDGEKKEKVKEELADAAVFLLYLASDLGIDILEAIDEKVNRNAKKYPVDKAKGSSKKYNEL